MSVRLALRYTKHSKVQRSIVFLAQSYALCLISLVRASIVSILINSMLITRTVRMLHFLIESHTQLWYVNDIRDLASLGFVV